MGAMKQLLVERIKDIAPKLTKRDVTDLLDIAESMDESALKDILTDYKTAGKLNKPEISKLTGMLRDLQSVVPLLAGLLSL